MAAPNMNLTGIARKLVLDKHLDEATARLSKMLEIEFEDTVLIDTPAWIAHAVIPASFAVTGYRFIVGAIRKAMGRDDDSERGTAL